MVDRKVIMVHQTISSASDFDAEAIKEQRTEPSFFPHGN